jgi:hypothetical protein
MRSPDLEEVGRGIDFDEGLARTRASERESPFDSPPVTRLPLDKEESAADPS